MECQTIKEDTVPSHIGVGWVPYAPVPLSFSFESSPKNRTIILNILSFHLFNSDFPL